MKLAATRALADLAKRDVPDSVCRIYGVERLEFGRHYIIPTPFDARLLIWVASAVASAAMETGAAHMTLNIPEYKDHLERRLGTAQGLMRAIIRKAQTKPKRVIFPEGEETKILRACQLLIDEEIATPILLGDHERIRTRAAELHLHLEGVEVVEPAASPRRPFYIEELYRLRQRKGVTRKEAEELILNPNVFGSLMVRLGGW